MSKQAGRTAFPQLYAVEPPWTYLDLQEPEDDEWLPKARYGRGSANDVLRVLRGKKMKTLQNLMNEFGAALQLFDGFGENWHALGECLSYLDEWMPASSYLLIISHPTEILIEEPDQITWLFRTLEEAGQWWSKPIRDNGRFNRGSVPFHTVLRVSPEDTDEALSRFPDIPRLTGVDPFSWTPS